MIYSSRVQGALWPWQRVQRTRIISPIYLSKTRSYTQLKVYTIWHKSILYQIGWMSKDLTHPFQRLHRAVLDGCPTLMWYLNYTFLTQTTISTMVISVVHKINFRKKLRPLSFWIRIIHTPWRDTWQYMALNFLWQVDFAKYTNGYTFSLLCRKSISGRWGSVSSSDNVSASSEVRMWDWREKKNCGGRKKSGGGQNWSLLWSLNNTQCKKHSRCFFCWV